MGDAKPKELLIRSNSDVNVSSLHSAKKSMHDKEQDCLKVKVIQVDSNERPISPDPIFPSSSIDMNVSLVETSQNVEKSPDAYKIVYFDLETSDFSNTADILQIAAKCGDNNFSVYLNPTQPVTKHASRATGLYNINGELYLYDTKVYSIPSRRALYLFLQFLQSLSQLCILVAHNAMKFDVPHLLRAIKSHNMIDDFKQIIGGFCDSLILLKKKFPNRKRSFKLSALAQDFLQRNDNENFHNATYDVKILENIVDLTINSNKEIFKNTKSFVASLMNVTQLQERNIIIKSLHVFKGTISDGMISKMAASGITYKKLKAIHTEKGKEAVVELLSTTLNDKKPRVTKNKRILSAIIKFLDKN